MPTTSGRRDFVKRVGLTGIGLGVGPVLAGWLRSDAAAAAEAAQNPAVRRGNAQRITILHTSDIHAQLQIHDEFFWEDGKPVYKRRGGLPTLRTMINTLRRQNPGHTLVVDGGDCFHGSAVASFSRGQAVVTLVNKIAYDLVLPGNWEVVYGKETMIADMTMSSGAKVCANMFHVGVPGTALIFPPYQVFVLSHLGLTQQLHFPISRLPKAWTTSSGRIRTSAFANHSRARMRKSPSRSPSGRSSASWTLSSRRGGSKSTPMRWMSIRTSIPKTRR